jgi:hypothetical protein
MIPAVRARKNVRVLTEASRMRRTSISLLVARGCRRNVVTTWIRRRHTSCSNNTTKELKRKSITQYQIS